MKINWIYIKSTNEDEQFIEFSNKTVFCWKNSEGKTTLASQILYPFSISHDLSDSKKESDQIIIEIQKNNKKMILRRCGTTKFAILKDGELITGDRELIYPQIFDFFEIPYYETTNSAAMFKSLFNPALILQTTKMYDLGFIDFTFADKSDKVVYGYWADSFRDEFANSNLKDEIKTESDKIRTLTKDLDEINKMLEFFSKFQWTTELEDKLQKVSQINDEISQRRLKIINLVTEEMQIEKRLSLLQSSLNQEETWRSRYKSAVVVIDGKKITFEDFLSKLINSDLNDDKISDLKSKLEDVKNKVIIFKREVNRLNEEQREILKSFENQDYFLIKSKRVSDVEKRKLDLISGIEKAKKELLNLKEKLEKIDYEIDVYNEISNDDEFKKSIEPRISASTDYAWLKIKLHASTGSEPVRMMMKLQKLALQNRGFEAPVIWDSPFDTMEEKNWKKSIDLVQDIEFDEKQVIVFIHDENQQEIFDKNIWQKIKPNDISKEIPKEVKTLIEKIKI